MLPPAGPSFAVAAERKASWDIGGSEIEYRVKLLI